MNPLTSRAQAEAIAAAVHLIRPTWDQPGILAAIAKVAQRHPCDVLMAAARAAANPELTNPGAIGNQAAECWRERVTMPTAYKPPKRHEACPLHLSYFRDSCAGCEADRKAGVLPGELQGPARPAPRDVAAAHLEAMRGAVRATKTEDATQPKESA